MQSYKVYTINFNKLALWLVNKANRKDRFLLLVKAILYPLINVHNSFSFYRKAKIYQLTITGQVCYLERLLNDKYDFTLRRIRIDDAVWHLPWFVYREPEEKPQFLYTESEGKTRYVYTEGEAGEVKDDFVVLVPLDIFFILDEMRSVIDSYRLAGTKYTIQRI